MPNGDITLCGPGEVEHVRDNESYHEYTELGAANDDTIIELPTTRPMARAEDAISLSTAPTIC